MTSELARFSQLKTKVEEAERRANKAEGALGEVKSRLKKEFDCDSLESAEKELKKLNKQMFKAKTEFDDALETFEEEWEDE